MNSGIHYYILDQREIKNLEIGCENSARGCAWIGTVSTSEKHLNECVYTLIPCPNSCKEEANGNFSEDQTLILQRKYLKSHLQYICPNRLHQCSSCGERDKFALMTGEHTNKCPMMTIACPSMECLQEFKRKDEEQHRNICEYTIVTCEYDSFGCSVKKMRREIQHHVENDSERHLECALEKN